MKRIVSSEKRQWIVVSSDRDIADHAWSRGSVPISADDFLVAIQGRQKFNSDEEDEDEYAYPRRKGNPRQLSKKEKAIRRALDKL